MSINTDILIELSLTEIRQLKDFYFKYKDDIPHIYSFLKTTLKWKQTHPEYITVFSIEGDWKTDGTFIALLNFSCYDIILFSLEETLTKLKQGLVQTKRIDWSKGVLFYATHEKITPTIYEAMKEINITIQEASVTKLWQQSETDAIKQTETYTNENFFMDKIKFEDAEVINEVWPPRYNTSLKYLQTFITMNGGFGIYEKSTNKLVSWILINVMGQLGVLQTREEYFKQGFGAALTKRAAKAVGENGDHPVGTVHDGNVASETLFMKCGFAKKYSCIYIHCQK